MIWQMKTSRYTRRRIIGYHNLPWSLLDDPPLGHPSHAPPRRHWGGRSKAEDSSPCRVWTWSAPPMAEWRFLAEFWVSVDNLPHLENFLISNSSLFKSFRQLAKIQNVAHGSAGFTKRAKIQIDLMILPFPPTFVAFVGLFTYETMEIFFHSTTEFFQIWLILIMYLILI